MALSSDIISQFAKIAAPKDKTPSVTTVNGTAVAYDNTIYVQLDGSDQLTPIASSTAGLKDGDRVTVQIKNHSATVTGNISSPSTGKDDLDQVTGEVSDMGDKITEFEIAIGNKVDVVEIDAINGRIDNLVSDNVTIKDKLTATEADIGKLEADNVTINEKLTAAEAEIDNLDATKIDFEIADGKYATIENLNATNADINNLEATYAQFEQTTTNRLNATDAIIQNLDAEYATIDFANINMAAVEKLFADSGIIQDLVVSEGHITGHLVGVTISGDLIEGNTIKADKLVVLGNDGLYYKLNVNAETVSAQQTEYNSLSGSIITANTITAEKINVDDLVAFDATIGGFVIDENAIHTNTKATVDSPARGVYLDNDGQVAFGDGSQYLKYYKTEDGSYKLEISASSVKFSTSDKTVEEVVNSAIINTEVEFYQSKSPTELLGGSWSSTQPTWTPGTYIWQRTLVTYGGGSTEYKPSANGVCITGNSGDDGEDAVILQILSSNGNLFKNTMVSTTLSVTIIVGNTMVTSSAEMYEVFGENAKLTWEQKLFGQAAFTPIADTDPRLSDNGFILTLSATDVYTQTVFNCSLSY